MSHGKLRTDKTCLNCEHEVAERFCPHCGQENTEPKQPFHYLFTHFIEDFTHYDGQFWGTLKNLLFSPGKLTNTYLSGKRQKFVPPVKLYIFISFITFFLFAAFPPYTYDPRTESKNTEKPSTLIQEQKEEIQEKIDILKSRPNIDQKDSLTLAHLNTVVNDTVQLKKLAEDYNEMTDMSREIGDDVDFSGYLTEKAYKEGTKNKFKTLSFVQDAFAHKFFELKESGITKGEILKKFIDTAFHNLPKALFLYLPIFAFFLWFFHGKKKWWYFDHGIFTLHYFSFLLLNIIIFGILGKLTNIIHVPAINILLYILMSILAIYSFVYFFVAHHRVYKSSRFISILIGIIISFCNFFAFNFLLVGLIIISFLMIH